MRKAVTAAFVLAALASANGVAPRLQPAAADSHGIEVTSTGDEGGAGGAECPHVTLCTLRRAIELANDDEEPGAFTITFSETVFPAGEPATIEVTEGVFPNISRDDVTVDATGRGVTVAGALPGLSGSANGLTVTGARFRLLGLHVRGFTGSCVAVTGAEASIGDSPDGAGNLFGGCETGLAISGADATVLGNRIGFLPDGTVDTVGTGMIVAAGDAQVGGAPGVSGASNRIGNAVTGIFVGSGTTGAFTGVVIQRNVLGLNPAGEPAPAEAAVVLAQPSSASEVVANAVHNSATGIALRPDTSGGVSVVRNRLSGNTFENMTALAIDLGDDGLRNPNDPGDADSGPNTGLNHPTIARATQTSLTGTACAGCRIEVYLANHAPGGMTDYGRTPLPGGSAVADGVGQFQVANPAAAAGQWLVALAVDADGNTSEFGPPARVGAGAVLCGNVQLQAGWTHAAYFGTEPVALFDSFPPSGGAVSAIYKYVDGTGEWQRWFAATTAGRTLHSVQPGESYWFLSTVPVTLAGGFSISFPVPVQLQSGPNDFVYLGASAHPLDALASLDGEFTDLYRYDAASASWEKFGNASVPAWAQDFDTIEACGVYNLRVPKPATLVPLQP